MSNTGTGAVAPGRLVRAGRDRVGTRFRERLSCVLTEHATDASAVLNLPDRGRLVGEDRARSLRAVEAEHDAVREEATIRRRCLEAVREAVGQRVRLGRGRLRL